MREAFDKLCKFVAKVYIWIPTENKVVISRAISATLTGLGTLIIADIGKINITNPYAALLVGLGLIVVDTLVNVLVKAANDYGTRLLVADKNPQAITEMETKLTDTKEILKQAK